MKTTTQEAAAWIEAQDTGYARTLREKAKYLVGKLTAHEIPHPAMWNEVLMIADGLISVAGQEAEGERR